MPVPLARYNRAFLKGDAEVGPRVSIIIPCYNKRAYVAAAIESALAQTVPCEVIVVDDGSTDGSLEVVRRFDGRILWETGPNRGGSGARNHGLSLATGKWIQFLDADDILPPEKIERQLAALSGAPEGTVAACPWTFLRDDGTREAPDPRPFWRDYGDPVDLLLDLWRLGGLFPPNVWLVPRTAIDRTGGWNIALTHDDDGEYFARVLLAAKGVRFVSDALALYRRPPQGSVSNDRSLASAQSCLLAWETVSAQIAQRRWDRAARHAVLSRLHTTAYAWRSYGEVLDFAAREERRLGRPFVSPALPPAARWMVGILGVRHGLRLRDALRSPRSACSHARRLRN